MPPYNTRYDRSGAATQPLAVALALDSELVHRYGTAPVSALKLAFRPAKCLERGNIETLEQLFGLSETVLLHLPNMGRGSVEQIKKTLLDLFQPQSPHPDEATSGEEDGEISTRKRAKFAQDNASPGVFLSAQPPPTLRSEWQSFAARSERSVDLPLHALKLSEEECDNIRAGGAASVEALLNWTREEAKDRLGDELAEDVLDALIVCACEQRRAHVLPSAEDRPDANELSKILRARWARTPLDALGLEKETVWWLAGAGGATLFGERIKDLAALIEEVDRPGVFLGWNLAAFEEVSRRLNALSLLDEGAIERRRALASSEPQFSLDIFVEACRTVCPERQWELLCDRCGLNAQGKPQTLQAIADTRKISRERARQIEGQGYKKLRHCGGVIGGLARSLRWITEEAGGVLVAREAGSRLTEFFSTGKAAPESICLLLFSTFSDFQPVTRVAGQDVSAQAAATSGPIYALAGKAPDFRIVIKQARALWVGRKAALRSDQWVEQVQSALLAAGHELEPRFVRACLSADGRFDPERFEVADVSRTLEASLVEVLQEMGAPAHYSDLTAKLNEMKIWKRLATNESVLSRMGAHRELFVCIDRGTYGLAAWGLAGQRKTRDMSALIGDLIEELLKARGEPCRATQIVAYVLARKRCHDYSVRQRLASDTRFHRFAPGFYGLKKWVL